MKGEIRTGCGGDGTGFGAGHKDGAGGGRERAHGGRRRSILLWSLVLAVFAGGVAAGWAFWPREIAFYTDADTIRQPAENAPVRDILWQPPRELTELINAREDDYEPRVSADGMTLFFVRGRAGENADIYVATRTPDGWGEPVALEAVNTEDDDLGPEPSADGRSLYFYSDRPGGNGGYDIWVVHRSQEDPTHWGEPVNLGPRVNSTYNDYGPSLTPDGRTLYFASNRPRPHDAETPDPEAWPATLREDLYIRDYDLYQATITERGCSVAQPVDRLNTSYNEGSPAVSNFGDFLYFASDRPGGEGGFDLYRSRRLNDEHEPAHNLGDPVNSAANELDPGMAMGGYALYFSSDRFEEPERASQGEDGATSPSLDDEEQSSPYNLYYTTSREVFAANETIRQSIDWAALWYRVAPNILWALLALLLLLALLKLMGGLRGRRLSLLARCLMASLVAHLLLMLMFNVWEVTTGLREALGAPRRGIQVAMISPAKGDQIAIQIRGHLTEVETPSWQSVQTDRMSGEIEVDRLGVVAELTVDRRPVELPETVAEKTQVQDAVPPELRSGHDVVLVHHLLSSPKGRQVVPRMSELLLPAETLPVVSEEDQGPPPIGNGVHGNVDRAELPVLSKPAAIRPGDFRLKPDSADAAEGSAPAFSLVVPTRPQDAQVRRSEELSISGPGLAASPVNLEGLNLPEAPATQQADEGDLMPTMVAASPGPARGRALVPASSPPLDEMLRVFAPLDSEDSQNEESLVSDSAQTMEEYALRPTQLRFRSDTANGAPLPPYDGGMRLPNLEEARDTRSVETKLEQLPHALGEAPRAALTSSELIASPTAPSLDFTGTPIPRVAVPQLDGAMSPALEPVLQETDLSPTPPVRVASFKVTERGGPLELRLSLPKETTPIRNAYVQRSLEQRLALIERHGGSAETERAVADALKWLAAHQSADGHWDAVDFDEGCGVCDGEAEIDADIAMTGLATLCFLGANHTHLSDGPYRETVAKAVRWLLERQDGKGGLLGDETMYSHGIATLALSEAYGMTDDGSLALPVQRAVDFIIRARSQREGGWRYEPGQAGDTSVLGWQVMALKSAELAGISVPDAGFKTARDWMDKVEHPGVPGAYGYQPGRRPNPAMTAEGMFTLQLLGAKPEERRMQNSAELISRYPPSWESQQNTYYWYYATLALFQHQGPKWERWNEAMTNELIASQRRDGAAAGSWDPEQDEWAARAGRVYQTTLCTLMLEVYYRYLPLYTLEAVPGAIGTMRGRVTDATTGLPLPEATVRLTMPGQASVLAKSGETGWYELSVPEVPEFFALSASLDGYLPETANIETARLRGRTIVRNFRLRPDDETVIALEPDPEVHHLGNDRFEGVINSQFQKRSEGIRAVAVFPLSLEQVASPFTRAELRLLAKGVQCPHRIFINDELLSKRLNRSPEDGSFGEFVASFDASILQQGENVLEIHCVSCRGDVDDFEFVNVQIHLRP
ncbi:MAG: PD40 domain-containing protein [Phycisphaerales bacterium]|nr:MAG: PD40 domain-containing protein [Phycisphaerales bacterium]